MVKKNKLDRYLDKRWRKITTITKTISRNPDSERIHELRLNGKKVKAITRLLKVASDHPKEFSLASIKPLFQDAGIIRTAELHLKQFKELDFQHAAFENEQQSNITWGYVLLGLKRKHYIREVKETRKRFQKATTEIKNREVVTFFKETIDDITLGFLWPVDIDQLHENRKSLKNLMYVYNMLPKSLQQKIGLNKDYIDKIQDIIGEWHDLSVTGMLLESKGWRPDGILSRIKQKETEKLEEVKREIELFDRKVQNASLSKSKNKTV